MNPSEIELNLIIIEQDADAERLDELTIRLMQDLRELGVDSVERPTGEAVPEGAKGEPFTIGVLTLVAVPAVLPSLFSFLQAWTLRAERRRVKIKTPSGLEIDIPEDMSEEKLASLVDKLVQARASENELRNAAECVARVQEVSSSGSMASEGGVSAGQAGVAVGRDVHGSVIIARDAGFDDFRRMEQYRDLQQQRDALREILGDVIPEIEAILTTALDTSKRGALDSRATESNKRLETLSPLFYGRAAVKGALVRIGKLVGSVVSPGFLLNNEAFNLLHEDRKTLEDELTSIERSLSASEEIR